MIEARSIAQAFEAARPSADCPTQLRDGEPPVELHVIGMRAVRLPQGLNRKRVCGIVLAGIAGALDPALAVGDVIIDSRPADLLNHLHLRHGKIHTSGHMIAEPAEKAELYRHTHAAAVDMESEMVRNAADAIGVPFVAVRGISDAADHVLDPSLFSFVDDFGRPKLSALAPALVRNPGMVQTLTRVRYNTNLATRAMAAIVRRLAGERDIWRSH